MIVGSGWFHFFYSEDVYPRLLKLNLTELRCLVCFRCRCASVGHHDICAAERSVFIAAAYKAQIEIKTDSVRPWRNLCIARLQGFCHLRSVFSIFEVAVGNRRICGLVLLYLYGSGSGYRPGISFHRCILFGYRIRTGSQGRPGFLIIGRKHFIMQCLTIVCAISAIVVSFGIRHGNLVGLADRCGALDDFFHLQRTGFEPVDRFNFASCCR